MTGRRGRHNIFKVTGKVVVFSLRQPPRHKQRRTLQEMWLFASCWQEILRLHCLCLLLPFALEVQQIPLPLSCLLATALAAFVFSEFWHYGIVGGKKWPRNRARVFFPLLAIIPLIYFI